MVVRGHAGDQPGAPRAAAPGARRAGAHPPLLDAGCGTGSNLDELAAFGRATGVDLSAEALRFCRTRGVSAARAGLLALPFPDGTFDGVTSFDVVYHGWVKDDRAAVREMARVLRPGRPPPRARARAEDAVGRPRRGGPLPPPLHEGRGAAPCCGTRVS